MNKSRKMSSRTYNKYYAKRGRNYLSYCLWYYEDEQTIVTEHKANILGKCILITIYPFVFIINSIAYGVSGTKGFNSAFIPTLKGKPFSQDRITSSLVLHWKEASQFIDSGKLPDRGL